MVYHRVVIDMSITDDEKSIIDLTTISNYVLLLPELGGYGYTITDILSLYYSIDSEWKELDKNTKFSSPISPGCWYEGTKSTIHRV